jgi:ubiquitin-protein ligase
MGTEAALLSILSRLYGPEIEDALEPDIARCYVDNYETFCAVARLHTKGYAHGVRPEMSELESFALGNRNSNITS